MRQSLKRIFTVYRTKNVSNKYRIDRSASAISNEFRTKQSDTASLSRAKSVSDTGALPRAKSLSESACAVSAVSDAAAAELLQRSISAADVYELHLYQMRHARQCYDPELQKGLCSAARVSVDVTRSIDRLDNNSFGQDQSQPKRAFLSGMLQKIQKRDGC